MSKCVCLSDRGTICGADTADASAWRWPSIRLCRLCRSLAGLLIIAEDFVKMDRVGDAVIIVEIIVRVRREIRETVEAELKA